MDLDVDLFLYSVSHVVMYVESTLFFHGWIQTFYFNFH